MSWCREGHSTDEPRGPDAWRSARHRTGPARGPGVVRLPGRSRWWGPGRGTGTGQSASVGRRKAPEPCVLTAAGPRVGPRCCRAMRRTPAKMAVPFKCVCVCLTIYNPWVTRSLWKPRYSSRIGRQPPHACTLSCPTLPRPHGLQPGRLLSPWDSRQEHWDGWPCPPPGDLPDPGIEPASPASAGGFFTTAPPGKPQVRPRVSANQRCFPG